MTELAVVVVGGGLGGLRTVEALRRLGHRGPITLVSEENLAPYDRPPLSKRLLDRDRLCEPPYLRAPDSYGELCEMVLGRRAVHLDVTNRAVVLDDGTELRYSAAVLATGASARHLPWLTGAHTLRTYQDAVGLREAILQHQRLTVVGAGFTGCEIASAAAAAGVSVTLLETAPTPLYRALGAEVGGYLRELLAIEGVDVRCDVAVTGLLEVNGGRRLALASGGTVDATVVAVCVGARPAVEWLADSGLELVDGIVCDAYGQTSAPGVYAVGDAVAWRYPGGQMPVRVEHWTTTAAQAAAVASNLLADANDSKPLNPLHYFWSDQCGTKLQCFGLPGPDDEVRTCIGADGRSLLAVYGDGKRATAVLGVGRAKQVLALRTKLAAGASLQELTAAIHELAAEVMN